MLDFKSESFYNRAFFDKIKNKVIKAGPAYVSLCHGKDVVQEAMNMLAYMDFALSETNDPKLIKQFNDLVKEGAVPKNVLPIANWVQDAGQRLLIRVIFSDMFLILSAYQQSAFDQFVTLQQKNPIITVYEANHKGNPAVIKRRQRVRGVGFGDYLTPV